MAVRKISIVAGTLNPATPFYCDDHCFRFSHKDEKWAHGDSTTIKGMQIKVPIDQSVLIDEYYVEIKISDNDRANLLCSALEGGSNYWYYIGEDGMDIVDKVLPSDGKTPTVSRIWAALKAGYEIPVRDAEDENEVLGKISLASIANGEQIMADKYPHHFTDIIAENDDGDTGDIWFQLAVMGEVVYG